MPGPFVHVDVPAPVSDRDYANGGIVDSREPLDRRFGGWYVTGGAGAEAAHGQRGAGRAARRAARAHAAAARLHVARRRGPVRDVGDYLTPYSDIVALLVLDHQLHATNLMTLAAWEYRLATWQAAGGSPHQSRRPRRGWR